MIDSHEFFVDLIDSIPSGTKWLMQFSFDDVREALDQIPLSKEGPCVQLNFKNEFRNQFIGLSDGELYEHINYFGVFQESKKLVEAFDGFVIVIVSKDFRINHTALPKYLNNDLLCISDDW